MKPYPPERQLPEIPFDVAEWGDHSLPWPEGLFRDEAEFDDGVAESSALPRTAPKPP